MRQVLAHSTDEETEAQDLTVTQAVSGQCEHR